MTISHRNRCWRRGLFAIFWTLLSIGFCANWGVMAQPVNEERLFNHYNYQSNGDIPLEKFSGVRLRPPAAAAFQRMAADALAVGVKLVPISGYRSLGHQRLLFFKGAEKRELSFEKRARTSAPPGYSEHHTGYALDIDDGEDSRIFRQSFVETAAGQWLLENAPSYCFELSFPAHGRQDLAYEPWHWRFVGTKHAAETFRAARMHDPADPAVSLDFSETTNEHRCTAAK